MTFKNITIGIITLLIILCSCDNTESFSSDDDFIQSDVRIIDVDTFAIEMSTYRYDSIISSGNRLLVGRYIDPYFGEVKASAYVEFTPANYYYTLDDDVVFDSIVLNLSYDGYYYSDTLLTKTIEVRKLAKEIRLPSSQTNYYNTTLLQSDNEVIGQKSFKPRIGNDSLTITLNPVLGNTIFNVLKSNNVNDREEFLNYLKGLYIAPSDFENAAITGFAPAQSYIRLYYSNPGDGDVESEYIDLVYNSSSNKFFNNIQGNASGTITQVIGGGQENEVKSNDLQDLAFIQSGLGLMTKVTFPSIRNIREYNDGKGDIFKAQLKIKLDKRYYNDNYPIRDSVYLCTVDQNNDIIAYGGVGYIAREDPEINEVYLTADVNFFLQSVLTDGRYLNYGLIFVPYNYNSSVDRLILNGENNQYHSSELKLTYVIYD
ncbi:DUF4270 family protein [Flavobacterium sp.]|uniref:DUF4270 family protein n=1 Tax=Flavobacterium sp. TaxID=239 RepID=UPI0026293BFB|nr:DUF4270 family protein [Flavobacterium sp.]